MKKVFISIIVPALNEAQSLEELYSRCLRTLNEQETFEFIIIDDGSDDSTKQVINRLQSIYNNIIQLTHRRNHGKSLSLMQGFDTARGDIAITMDADLQDQPEAIIDFISKINEGYDFVNGWRKNRNDNFFRKTVSKIFNYLIGFLLNCNLHDINCGYKAMRKTVYKSLQLRGDLHRLIPAIAASYGFKVSEVIVPHAKRKYGKSRYSLFRLNGLLDIIAFKFTCTTQFRPFQIFSKLALLLLFLGIIAFFSFYYFNLKNFYGSILFFISIWLIFIGTLLPLFGLFLDILSGFFQDKEWRAKLLQITSNTKKNAE